MSERAWKAWREFWSGRDQAQAERVEAVAHAARVAASVHPALRQEMQRLDGSSLRVEVGAFHEPPLAGTTFPIGLDRLLAHMLVLGGTGSGKSFFLLLLIARVLRSLRSLVIFDLKNELAETFTESVLPGIAATLPPQDARQLLDRVVVINPFSATHLPPLNVLVRDPGLPIEVQAQDVAECFETATEADVSLRMGTILGWLLRLVIGVGGYSFHAVFRALQEPLVLEGLVRVSSDIDAKRYFLTRYAHEPKGSKLALLARLDRFLALPMTRLCLGSRQVFDFDQLLADRIVIVSLGGAPAGLQSVARFFAMVLLTRFVRALFRQPVRVQGPASLLVADEWQLALNPALASEFESVLTLARSRRLFLWLANQQLAQLDGYGGSLRSIALGQTSTQALFRLSPEDARSLRHLFPATGSMPRLLGGSGRREGAFLSPAEELDARLGGASRLPNRVGYWCDKPAAWESVLFKTATLPIPAPRSLDPSLVRRASQGTIAFGVRELEAMRRDEDQRIDALAAGASIGSVGQGTRARAQPPPVPSPLPPSQASSSGPLPPTPKVAAKRKRRRGGGSLPQIG